MRLMSTTERLHPKFSSLLYKQKLSRFFDQFSLFCQFVGWASCRLQEIWPLRNAADNYETYYFESDEVLDLQNVSKTRRSSYHLIDKFVRIPIP